MPTREQQVVGLAQMYVIIVYLSYVYVWSFIGSRRDSVVHVQTTLNIKYNCVWSAVGSSSLIGIFAKRSSPITIIARRYNKRKCRRVVVPCGNYKSIWYGHNVEPLMMILPTNYYLCSQYARTYLLLLYLLYTAAKRT